MPHLGTILLVPGIGGCQLQSPPAFFGLSPGIPIWLNPAVMIAGGWRLLGLAPNGLDPDVILTGPMVPGLPLPAYYDLATQHLTAKGWNVVGARLDWRQDLWLDGQRLAEQIEANQDNGPVHLVAHSRGGLVCRAALKLLGDVGKLHLVGRCVGLGVPHYGSWEAAGLLAGWNTTANLLAHVLDGSAYLLSGGNLKLSIAQVILTWPAAYQLLPSPSAPGLPADQANAIYNPAIWQSLGVSVSTVWLQHARNTWLTLPMVPLGIDWIDFRGVGQTTPHELLTPYRFGTFLGWLWAATGDTTVRSDWAAQPGRFVVSAPVDHGAIVQDRRVLDVVDQVLQNGTGTNIDIPGAVLATAKRYT